MLYENELAFLSDTLKKLRVPFVLTTPDEPLSTIVGAEINSMFDFKTQELKVKDFIGEVIPFTVYKSTGVFKLSYLYFLLADGIKRTVLFIGPYLSTPLSSHEILEIGEECGLSRKRQQLFGKYYSSVPVLPPDSHLFMMISAFCERMWNGRAFAVVDVNHDSLLPASPINDSVSDDSFEDMLVSMNIMEKRYDFENELIRAVSLGQIHKEGQLLSALSNDFFERRTTDPLRNAKNYCIIMNTLLRKAAEQGGVHPVYLDRVSSAFAYKIEQLPMLSENAALMREMFRAYCRLVRKHTMKDFSPVVQKTILLIDSDLSANLSLTTLANSQGISSGYLSTLFRRETGKTVSEYIRDKRMKHAAHLLGTTHLQVQTIALHCGIMDVQYFSKTFKKHSGMTPKEYREAIRSGAKNIR